MRIDPRAAAFATGQSGRPAAGGRGFSIDERTEARKSTMARATASLATVDALVTLQGEGDPGERKRRSARRGQDLLEGLDRLKAALLSGRVTPSDLRSLSSRLAIPGRASGDPGLDEVVAHIELRAEVELAKLKAARGQG